MLRVSHAVLLGLLGAGLLFACGEKLNPNGDVPTAPSPGGSSGGGAGGGTTESGTGVSYSTTIKPLLDKFCTSCHSASGTATPSLDTYAAAKAYGKASNEAIQGTGAIPMPPGGSLSAELKKAFQDWIDQGALNN